MRSNYAVICEHFTGCRQHPAGMGKPLVDGKPVSMAKSRQTLLDGCSIEFPQAGAGSFDDLIEKFGGEWEMHDNTSSAGDWSFIVKLDGIFYPMYQTHAGNGYRYNLDNDAGTTERADVIL